MKLVLAVMGVALAMTVGWWFLAYDHPKAAVLGNGVTWLALTIWANTFGIRHIYGD